MPEAKIISPEFLAAFRARADAAGAMTFAAFMELALYHPSLGYYRAPKKRIGRGAETDFFTASTSAPVFGELVAAACAALLAPEDPRDFIFVEIGAETPGGVLADVVHPFAGVRVLPLGETLDLSGRCVVFSNELFDAQPFRRFVFRHGAWRELGVTLRDDSFVEVELPAQPSLTIPASDFDRCVFDAPLAASELARHIAAQPWTGLFVACDYGKSLRELLDACPAGTARAYYRHTQSNDLLARPGEQDLTCHICWDWLSDALEQNDFASPQVDSQESFFVRHAAAAIAAISSAEATRFSQKKLSLLQLLHPSHLGQKFQVLHALRR